MGYGDVYPITVGGKAFAAVISLVGIGVVAIQQELLALLLLKKSLPLNEEKSGSQNFSCQYFLSLFKDEKKILILGSGFLPFCRKLFGKWDTM